MLEDGDSVITGLGTATITPADGDDGFYRGIFNASRFQGGGLEPKAVTKQFFVGPFLPTFTPPTAADLIAACPVAASRGVGTTAMLVEIQGYPILPDGTPDSGAPTGWYTVGYFADSGVEISPTWFEGVQPPDVLPPGGPNAGAGIGNVNGSAFIEVRTSFYLPTGFGAVEPGPFIDRWTIRFTYDQ